MSYTEQVLTFQCDEETMHGVLSLPPAERAVSTTGVLIVVGGPQYRAGSHRQFVLLARMLAATGFPVLRFDYRGMGDSGGSQRDFRHVTPDIAAAIETFQAQVPVQRVVLWGLCDGASAALLYCYDTHDPRVQGLCLLNPWVRSDASLARAHVKHYYADRVRQKEFWRKLLSGKVAFAALSGLWRNLRLMNARARASGAASSHLPFQQRMALAWQGFPADVLLLLSGADYTAKEFEEHARVDSAWAGLLSQPRVTRRDIPLADHTLSDTAHRLAAEEATLRWLQACVAAR